MITLIIKTTDGCNLRCRYCSVGKKGSDFRIISVDNLKKAVDTAVLLADSRETGDIRIIFHGGEPTIIDPSLFEDMVRYACGEYPQKSFRYSVQTNGYRISDEWLAFMKKHSVSVGVSIDGSQAAHNAHRLAADGSETYSGVLKNITELKNAGLHVSVLVVVTPELLGEDLTYINFFNYHGIDLRINPLLDVGEARENKLSLVGLDYAEYLIHVYEYMLDSETEIRIDPISDIVGAVMGGRPISECSYKGNCGERFVCVDYNGRIYPCGRFADIGAYGCGNAAEYMEADRRSVLSEECESCRWLKFCHGGCPAYRFSSGGKNPLCAAEKRLFEYFSGEGIDRYISYLKAHRDYLDALKQELERKCDV